MRPESAIVVPRQEHPAPAPRPAPGAGLADDVAQGRARFRERFEAHRRGQAQRAADEAGARALVGRWDRLLVAYEAALPWLDTDPAAFGLARGALLGFGQEVRRQPGPVAVLREGDGAYGMAERPALAGVLADARPERAVGEAVEAAEAGMRAWLQEQARERAAQEEARRQEQAQRPRPVQRSGPSMGM